MQKKIVPEWSLAAVRSKMIIQMFLARKCFLAYRTAERFIGRMAFHVTLQAGIVGENVIANVAHKHFHAVVDLTVCG